MPRKSQADVIGARLTAELVGRQASSERTADVLLAVGRALGGLADAAAVIDGVAYLLPDAFNADAAALWLHEPQRRRLWTRQTCHHLNWPATVRTPEDHGPCGYAFEHEHTVRVGDRTEAAPWREPGPCILADAGAVIESMMLAPVHDRSGVCRGVLQIADARPRHFSEADLATLEAVARQVGFCLEHAQAIDAHARQFNSFLRAVVAALDARDAVTVHHSANVANYAVGIGQAIGLDQRHLRRLHTAALLHDLGKLGTPDRLLTKAGPLDPGEMEEVKTHAAYTRFILRQVEFVAADDDLPGLAAAHHEKLDGSGYPDGLTGTQIPLDVRVLTVADMFHALTQPRHHRPGIAPEKALAVLDNLAPAQLDTRCVDALRQFLGLTSTSPSAA